LVFVLGLSVGVWVTHSTQAGDYETPTFDNVLRADLESADGLEVIVSLVEIPAQTTLPEHHHPGEEFVYLLEGNAVLWLKDSVELKLKEGDAAKVPLEHVHTDKTGEEAAKILVFRVHKKGEPERIPAS
jgi:quercetin dioxygenase-like cupin family protein